MAQVCSPEQVRPKVMHRVRCDVGEGCARRTAEPLMTRADVVIAADGCHVYFNLTGGLRSVDEHPWPVPTHAVCSSEDGPHCPLLNPTTRVQFSVINNNPQQSIGRGI
jgi:hypothetical protein